MAKLIPRFASHIGHLDPGMIQKFTEWAFPDGSQVYRTIWNDTNGLKTLGPYYPLTLRQAISPQPRMTDRERLQLMLGIANRLAIAHEVGLIHRDLKPSNG